MKTNHKFTALKLVVLGVLVAGLNAKAAEPPALKGNFTLTAVTHWGPATLPAGAYSFTVDHDYPGSVITITRGTQFVARIQAPGINDLKSGNSEIVMVGGAVTQLNLPTLGVSLHYLAPKSHGRADSQSPLAQVIPVTTAGTGR